MCSCQGYLRVLCCAPRAAQKLPIAKEKELILYDRAAQACAKLILPQHWLLDIEKTPRIENVVARIVIRRAVIRVCSRLCDHLNNCPLRPANLCRVKACYDLNFLDRVNRWPDTNCAIIALVIVHSIYHVIVVGVALPVRKGIGCLPAVVHFRRIANGVRCTLGNSRAEKAQTKKLRPFKGRS